MNKRIMANHLDIDSLLTLFVCIVLLFCFYGCADRSDDSSANTEVGDIAFKIVLQKRLVQNGDGTTFSYAVKADAEDDGIDHIMVHVYDGDTLLKEGGPWNWSAGSGTVEGIPAGTGRDVIVLVYDANQNILYRGQASGINITAGQTNDAGTINCNDFIPVLTLPLDGDTVTSNAFDNQWEAVSGASEYNLVISENEDLSDPLDDIIITQARYRRNDIATSTTFYWSVAAMDEYGNQSLWSDIWHFTTDTTINQSPSANIQSPANNDAYNLGDDVAFSGTGVDDEDGELTGNDLVWTSDLDGQIGTGETFTKNDLSEGTHRITLSATDGDGASGETSINVTIIGSGAPVADAGTNQRVTVGNTVNLDGSASSDPNDDPLTYSWSFTSIPTDSTAQLTDDTTQAPSFVADIAGNYVVSLVVNDGSQDSSADSVTITATESDSEIYSFDFEDGMDNWSSDNGVWEVGAPTSGPFNAHSGSNAAGTVLSGDYPNTTSRLISSTIELPAIESGEEVHLRFWQWFSLDNYDSLNVQVSQQTATNVWADWETLDTYNGSSGVWSNAMVDLSAYAGRTVRIGFQLSQGSFTSVGPGWFVDDVSIEIRPTTVLGTTDQYSFDFDEGMGDWGAHNGSWDVGAPTSGPFNAHSGSNVAGTVLSGDYPNTTSRLVSPTIELPAIESGEEIHLRFWQWFSLDNYDSLNVQVSQQTATGIWADWETLDTYNGSSGVWSNAMVDLSAYAGRTVRIGFQLSQGSFTSVGPGWFMDDVSIEIRPTTVLGTTDQYSFDFDEGMGDWGAHNGSWEVGAPTSGPNSAYSGSNVAGTVLSGDYPNTTSRLVSPTIELPAIESGEEIHLRFWQWFSLDNYDSLNVRVSQQTATGVWADWQTLDTYSGSSGVWSNAMVDLSAYAGRTVRIGFELSQGSFTSVGPGWFVDDVQIEISN